MPSDTSPPLNPCVGSRGLLELSKSFLDAFGLRTPGEQPIEVDVFISEVNKDLRVMAAGAPTRPEPASFLSSGAEKTV